MSAAPEQRFWAKVQKTHPHACWIWAGIPNTSGYGQLSVGGRLTLAHRFAYELLVGPIPSGLVMDHYVCDTPLCVNPIHLKPVTNRENLMRGRSPSAINARKRCCPQCGGAFRTTQHGHRYCASCHTARCVENAAANPEAARRRWRAYRERNREKLRARARIRMRAKRAAAPK